MASKAKRPACPECGSANVFAAIDVRWRGELQRWGINQTRMADDCTEIDCMDCDHRGMLDDGGFPNPCEHVVDAATVYSEGVALAAMCLWEAVVAPDSDESVPWHNDRDEEGTCALRDRILGMAAQCDSDWAHAQEQMGFDDSFDWEFAPGWLRHNYGKGFTAVADRLAFLNEGNRT